MGRMFGAQWTAVGTGIRPESVYKAARRGRQEARRWQQVLELK